MWGPSAMAEIIDLADLSKKELRILLKPPKKPKRRKCPHLQLKQHDFKDGDTIYLCPDCCKPDEQRKKTLRLVRLFWQKQRATV
jgi:hypothetical protein